ncbi:MAG: endonuclease/exonuclease/phosphatase family protein, partial [Chloroflexota bacterium]|nr:endonuclease/exonuclease/phosphatase family protein [Chloroflexota bacterium]
MLPLRVMTFNVRGAYHQDGENRWEHRSALNIDTIRRHSPDVVGLQEVQDPNLDAYLQHLPQYRQQQGPRAENEDPHGYNVILWNPERLEAG